MASLGYGFVSTGTDFPVQEQTFIFRSRKFFFKGAV
jgi:hypothetical protein